MRFIANKLGTGDDQECRENLLDVRLGPTLAPGENAIFLEGAVTDASDFASLVPAIAFTV